MAEVPSFTVIAVSLPLHPLSYRICLSLLTRRVMVAAAYVGELSIVTTGAFRSHPRVFGPTFLHIPAASVLSSTPANSLRPEGATKTKPCLSVSRVNTP